MGLFSSKDETVSPLTADLTIEIENLTTEVARLRGTVTALTEERERWGDVERLQRKIAELEIEKSKLDEERERKDRDTNHKVGLLKSGWEQEKALQVRENEAALREAKLTVREENLAADQTRFKSEMDFQRNRLQGEVDRIDGLVEKLLERLPTIEVSLEGPAQTAPARTSRRSSSKEE